MREFTSWLDGLLSRLDQGVGWCGVFWQRDPDGMRACLDGREMPPWDVVEALLADYAARYGGPAAAAETDHARLLHAAALAAHDARPGARDALADRLDVMLREQKYASERETGLTRRLASTTAPEEIAALRLDLAWARDDLDRATARCAELRARIARLDDPLGRRRPGAADGAPAAGPRAAGRRAGASDDWFGTRQPSGPRPGDSDGTPGPGGSAETPAASAPGQGHDRAASAPGGAHDFPASAPGQGHDRAASAPGGAHDFPASAPGQGHDFMAADPDRPARPAPAAPGSPAHPVPAPEAAPEPPAPTPPAPKPRKRRRGSARFAGAPGEELPPAVVPVVGAPPQAVPAAPAAAPLLKGARFAGAPEGEAAPRPARQEPRVDEAAREDVRALVARLGRLRADGRSGDAHILLVEAAHWPAERYPLLAAALERAGLGADWATLLWEAASLPAARLVAAADVLTAAGRRTDGEQLLRQGVARPAPEIGEAVRALAAEGHDREIAALLDACVRARTPEEAARCAAPDPGLITPLLLRAAQGVSDERYWDLVHALRVAGTGG
ncbi:hypothetical protein ACFQE4_27530 [Streptomyces thermocoprophilus]|uniref:UL36 very large tegument protein n=1 Tax=Streptomyces thermocoprophilus TaxID=78356 RepID=A0ABV5VB69_9ACTN